MEIKKQYFAYIFLLIAFYANAKDVFSNDSLNHSITRNDVTPAIAPFIFDTLFITWTGLISTNWNHPNNWSGNAVPKENDDIIIPAGTPFSPEIPNGSAIVCNSIKVMNGAAITIATGGVLQVKSGTYAPGTPSLLTTAATLITNVSAQLGGTITSIGDCAISQYGLALSTFNNPTIYQATYPDISINGVGTFSIPVGSLLPATTYYVRTYATNCKGTSYGNEISFTTTGGGASADTGYFRLTTGGITYFSYDLQSPKVTTVFPEGDTRFAYVTRDVSQNTFNIAAQSSFLLNPSKSFGFSFGYINPDVNGTGIYSFAKAPGTGVKAIEITIRSAPGASNAALPNYNLYANTGNFSRHIVDDNCEEAELVSLNNTLIITRWGNLGEFVEGTISGTLYENVKTFISCKNSVAKPFIVEFKLKRVQ